MQLLDKFKSFLPKKQAKQEYFFALIFKEKAIKAVLWEEKQGQVNVVEKSDVDSEKELVVLSDEEFLALCDQAIGLAEKNLPANTKTAKTIFGLDDAWVEGSTIKEPYFSKIKKVCKELALAPLGFVVFTEAITLLLTLEEGTPPTVILVHLESKHVSVHLLRAGRVEAHATIETEGKTNAQATAEAVKSFGDVEILPSRILLYDGKDVLEEAKQEFIAFSWTKSLPFLHFPKIDILPEDIDSKAVLSGAAKEMGFAFEEIAKPVVAPEVEQVDEALLTEEETLPKKEVEEIVEPENVAPVEDADAQAFGFVVNGDVAKEVEAVPFPIASPTTSPSSAIHMPSVNLVFAQDILHNMKTFIQSLSSHMRFGLPIFILIAIVVVVISALFFFIPSAKITLAANTKAFERDAEVIIDTNSSSVDSQKKTIPGTKVETTVDGEKTAQATGKKIVGDRARGELTIYNKTENRKTFPKGTILTAPNNLQFTLDEDTTIASTSAFELTPSSVKAKVTAAQIGEESNLPANTNFPFKEFPTSSYFAKNDAPFSGGTKRDALVVSKDDQSKLLSELTDELLTKAKDELTQKAGGNRIVDISLTQDITSKKFSKNVDDEANDFSLKLAMNISTISYKDADLLTLVGDTIQSEVPNGFIFQKDKFETSVKNIQKEKTGTIPLTIHYKATLIPNIDTEQVKKIITGKSKAAVENYLKSLPLTGFQIAENIALPAPFNLLPQRQENITIEVTSN